jgi:hypothetical protein
MHRSSNNSHKQWHKQQLPWLMYNLHKRQDQHNHNCLPLEDNQAVEADNHNNLPPEDNRAVEEVVEVEAVEAEEANLQQDNKLQDKQQPHHLAQNLSKE